MKCGSKPRTTTLDRWSEAPSFQKKLAKEYGDLALAELILALMEQDTKSVRQLAKEVGVSKTVIQNLRSGKQPDMKLRNFLRLTEAYGFRLVLEKGRQRIPVRNGRAS